MAEISLFYYPELKPVETHNDTKQFIVAKWIIPELIFFILLNFCIFHKRFLLSHEPGQQGH